MIAQDAPIVVGYRPAVSSADGGSAGDPPGTTYQQPAGREGLHYFGGTYMYMYMAS